MKKMFNIEKPCMRDLKFNCEKFNKIKTETLKYIDSSFEIASALHSKIHKECGHDCEFTSKERKKVLYFTNPGCGDCILLQTSDTDYFLAMVLGGRHEFVVGFILYEDGSWAHGNYFNDIIEASKYFERSCLDRT